MQHLSGTFDPAVAQAQDPGAALRAPGRHTGDGVSVAVRGRPSWRRQPEAEANDALAAELCAAYRTQGTRLLQDLHGSFSIAICDATRERLLLAIDRMGIERLAYTADGGRITFSTSAESVARACSETTRLDRQALFDYLFFHMVPSPRTVFHGVQKLPAATLAVFERGQLQLSRYWDPEFVERGSGDFDGLKRDLDQALRTAVRAAAPGPKTGAFLSGGLDSSTVAGVLSEVGPRPARTFSIGFGFEAYDELRFARIANQRFGCLGHEYDIEAEDIVAAFPAIAAAYDEPFGNSSALPAYYCAKLALKHGVDHLLAGDGGDELFAGNSRYADQRVFDYYARVPGALRSLLEAGMAAWPAALTRGVFRKGKGYVAMAKTPLPDRLESYNFVRRIGPEAIFEPEFLRAVNPDGPVEHMREVYSAAPSGCDLNRMLFYDWRFTLADNDLRKVEAMCELAGVRVSYPMLHPDVVEVSNRVPPGLKMPDRRLRDFYKRAMAGFLPEEIIHKKKHGFGLPFGLWLEQSAALRSVILGSLASFRGRGIVREDFIDRLLALHGADDAAYYGVFVWVLAMLEQWLQAHRASP